MKIDVVNSKGGSCKKPRLKKQEGSIVMNCKKDGAKTAASTEYERRGSTSIIADEAKAAAAARMPVEEVIAAANAKKNEASAAAAAECVEGEASIHSNETCSSGSRTRNICEDEYGMYSEDRRSSSSYSDDEHRGRHAEVAEQQKDQTEEEDDEIKALIEERRNIGKEDKEQIKHLSKKIKKCIRDSTGLEDQKRFSEDWKSSKESRTFRALNLRRKGLSFQSERMEKAKSSHQGKELPMSLERSAANYMQRIRVTKWNMISKSQRQEQTKETKAMRRRK